MTEMALDETGSTGQGGGGVKRDRVKNGLVCSNITLQTLWDEEKLYNMGMAI